MIIIIIIIFIIIPTIKLLSPVGERQAACAAAGRRAELQVRRRSKNRGGRKHPEVYQPIVYSGCITVA